MKPDKKNIKIYSDKLKENQERVDQLVNLIKDSQERMNHGTILVFDDDIESS